MNCPQDGCELEFISGQFDTGVVAPDGYRESIWQEGFYCAKCGTTYDESELDELIAEGNDPEFVRPA
jgi:hypothetical protein